MTSYNYNSYNLVNGFNIGYPTPIDSRMKVDYYTDLADIPNKYDGLICYVSDDKTYYTYKQETWEPLIESIPDSVIEAIVNGTYDENNS